MGGWQLKGPGNTGGTAPTGNNNNTNTPVPNNPVNQTPTSAAVLHPRGNRGLQRQIITALRQRLVDTQDNPPLGISQMLNDGQTPIAKSANKSPEAMNLVLDDVLSVPRGDSFGYRPDFNLARQSAANRRERIISLAYDRFRRHLTLPAPQRPILSPTTKNVEAHATAFARLTKAEQRDICPYLESDWRIKIVDSLPDKVKTALASYLAAQKSDSAPIQNLTWPEATQVLQRFRQNIQTWKPDFNQQAIESSGILDQPLEGLSKEEQDAIRLYHTHKIIKDMAGVGTDVQPLFTPSAIFFDNMPAGMMFLATKLTPPEIGYLVTHPGSTTAGGAMIEHAVNSSGPHGVVELSADNPAAKSAYEAMGFVTTAGKRMRLNPSTSDKWQQVNGRWQLTAHVGDKFLVGSNSS